MIDVVVIGGGPVGSTVSTLLANQGLEVELFERETFPRFHIGESLIPETYWVLKRLRVWDPILNKGAIWTYWEGAYRDTGRDEGATMVLQTPDKQGWFWYIPQHDNVVSVGIVGPFDYLFKNRGKDFEKIYDEEVERTPAVKKRIAGAARVTGYFATKDYSYRTTSASGDGWVLVGDAWGFLDPLYSSGVLLALKSGELAADAIVEGLKKGR